MIGVSDISARDRLRWNMTYRCSLSNTLGSDISFACFLRVDGGFFDQSIAMFSDRLVYMRLYRRVTIRLHEEDVVEEDLEVEAFC